MRGNCQIADCRPPVQGLLVAVLVLFCAASARGQRLPDSLRSFGEAGARTGAEGPGLAGHD